MQYGRRHCSMRFGAVVLLVGVGVGCSRGVAVPATTTPDHTAHSDASEPQAEPEPEPEPEPELPEEPKPDPPPPEEPKPEPVVAPHEVAVTVEGADDEVLAVTVRWGEREHVVRHEAQFEYCDYVDADHQVIEGAPGLHLVQLLCTMGEDYQSRDSATALLVVGDVGDAKIAWSGEGSSSNEMGCVHYDVLFFRVEPDGRVAVMREQGAYNGGSDGPCEEREVPDEVVEVLSVRP